MNWTFIAKLGPKGFYIKLNVKILTWLYYFWIFSYCFMIHKTFNEGDQSEKVVYTHVLTKGLNIEEHYGKHLI